MLKHRYIFDRKIKVTAADSYLERAQTIKRTLNMIDARNGSYNAKVYFGSPRFKYRLLLVGSILEALLFIATLSALVALWMSKVHFVLPLACVSFLHLVRHVLSYAKHDVEAIDGVRKSAMDNRDEDLQELREEYPHLLFFYSINGPESPLGFGYWYDDNGDIDIKRFDMVDENYDHFDKLLSAVVDHSTKPEDESRWVFNPDLTGRWVHYSELYQHIKDK